MSLNSHENDDLSKKDLYEIFKECSKKTDYNKFFVKRNISASSESTFYDRAVEEFWIDPLGGISSEED